MGINNPTKLNYLLELIFPVHCVVCKEPTQEKPKNRLVCTNCLSQLKPKVEFLCPNCQTKSIEGRSCIMCRDTYPLDRLFTLYKYGNESKIQEVIHAFKYLFIRDLNTVLKEFCYTYIDHPGNKDILSAVDVIVPIPLNRLRFNWRGYNQSELIAQSIAVKLGKPVVNLLKRRGLFSIPQVKLQNHDQRLKNVHGLFKYAPPHSPPHSYMSSRGNGANEVKNKTVLLVDDVYTSGATMQECARVLKSAGATEVWGFAIARG